MYLSKLSVFLWCTMHSQAIRSAVWRPLWCHGHSRIHTPQPSRLTRRNFWKRCVVDSTTTIERSMAIPMSKKTDTVNAWMYVCMYVCINVCLYVYICTYICMYVYVCMHVCICACVYVEIYLCIRESGIMNASAIFWCYHCLHHTNTRTRARVCLYVRMHVHNFMYVCRCVYTCLSFPAHTPNHTLQQPGLIQAHCSLHPMCAVTLPKPLPASHKERVISQMRTGHITGVETHANPSWTVYLFISCRLEYTYLFSLGLVCTGADWQTICDETCDMTHMECDMRLQWGCFWCIFFSYN